MIFEHTYNAILLDFIWAIKYTIYINKIKYVYLIIYAYYIKYNYTIGIKEYMYNINTTMKTYHIKLVRIIMWNNCNSTICLTYTIRITRII